MKKNGVNFWTIPNILTYIRIISIAPMIWLMFLAKGSNNYFDIFFFGNVEFMSFLAAFIYAYGAVTDWLDGYIAKKYNQFSDFGRALDPIADKLIVIAVLMVLCFTKFNAFEVVLAYLIVFREILISGFREALADYNMKMPVIFVARVKTYIQMFAVGFLMAFDRTNIWYDVGFWLLVVAVVLTLYTGVIYMNTIIKTLVGKK